MVGMNVLCNHTLSMQVDKKDFDAALQQLLKAAPKPNAEIKGKPRKARTDRQPEQAKQAPQKP